MSCATPLQLNCVGTWAQFAQVAALTGRVSTARWAHTAASSRVEDISSLASPDKSSTLTPRKRLEDHVLTPYVDVNSLERTIENHRVANFRSRIKKLPAGPDLIHERPLFLESRRIGLGQQDDHGDDGSGTGKGTKISYIFQRTTGDAIRSFEHASGSAGQVSRRKYYKEHTGEDLPEETDWISRHGNIKRLRRFISSAGMKNVKPPPQGILNYRGTYCPYPGEDMASEGVKADASIDSQLQEPWATRHASSLDDLDRLEHEIETFCGWVLPSAEEVRGRRRVVELALEIARLAETVQPSLRAELYGSETTGLSTCRSDIDIRISDARSGLKPDEPRLVQKRHFNACRHGVAAIAMSLTNHPDFERISVQSRPFPLVQALHSPSGLTIQFVVSPETSAAQKLVGECLQQHAAIRPVYMVLKTALGQRDLLTPYHGHLSSYALFNMVIATLKARQSVATMYPLDMEGIENDLVDLPNKAKKTNQTDSEFCFPSLRREYVDRAYPSPGLLLLDTLYLFTHLYTSRFGISARDGLLSRKWVNDAPLPPESDTEERRWKHAMRRMSRVAKWQPYLLTLQDGADPKNDLGRKADAWKLTQATLMELWKRLDEKSNLFNRPNADTASPPRPSRVPAPVSTKEPILSPAHLARLTSGAMRHGANGWSSTFNDEAPAEASQQKSWTLSSGILEPSSISQIQVPLIRDLVGRVDKPYDKDRTRLELFANDRVPSSGASAVRKELSKDDQRKLIEGYLIKLAAGNVIKQAALGTDDLLGAASPAAREERSFVRTHYSDAKLKDKGEQAGGGGGGGGGEEEGDEEGTGAAETPKIRMKLSRAKREYKRRNKARWRARKREREALSKALSEGQQEGQVSEEEEEEEASSDSSESSEGRQEGQVPAEILPEEGRGERASSETSSDGVRKDLGEP